MELKNKELCGKNIYLTKRLNKFFMYFNDKKVGEIELNNEGNIIALKAYNKKYVKNLIYYIDSHKNLTIDDINGFPNKYEYLEKIKDRMHPDLLMKHAILANSTTLARYALEREACLTKETIISSAINSSKILEIHISNNVGYLEEAMEAAFENKNYGSIKVLIKKTKNINEYINRCNEEDKYQLIKKYLIQELVKRNKKSNIDI